MNIGAIKPEDIADNWIWLEGMIAPALYNETEELTADDVKDMLENGQMLCLYACDESRIYAVQTLEVIKKENYKLMNLVTTVGEEFKLWGKDLSDTLDQLAQDFGCEYIHTRGRLGWLRALQPLGYKPLYHIAEKKIELRGPHHGRQ